MSNQIDLEVKCYKTLRKYVQKYSPEKLEAIENGIFGEETTRRRRCLIESERIKRTISEDPYSYIGAIEELSSLIDTLKLIRMGDVIIDEAYDKIIKLNIICGMPIRLSSGIYPLADKLSKKVRISLDRTL